PSVLLADVNRYQSTITLTIASALSRFTSTPCWRIKPCNSAIIPWEETTGLPVASLTSAGAAISSAQTEIDTRYKHIPTNSLLIASSAPSCQAQRTLAPRPADKDARTFTRIAVSP